MIFLIGCFKDFNFNSDGRDVNEQHKLVPIPPSSSPETLTASEVGEQLDEPQMPVKSLRDILKKKRFVVELS